MTFRRILIQFIALVATLQFTLHAQIQPTTTYQPPPIASGNVSSTGRINERWSELLGNALYFYDIQRAGTLPTDFRVEWRNNSVPNDGNDVGLNLSGGFFDAGNYIKATFPLCWVVTQLSWGAMMYGQGFDNAQQTAYLDETLRVALDWLMTASSNPDLMVVLIGTSDFYWGGDLNIPLNDRPSYTISPQHPGTDVYGSCASAMASASMLYAGTVLPISSTQNGTVASLQNSTYSQSLLQRAEFLHNLAQTSQPQQVYQKATKGVSWAYPSTDYADELVLSSTFLAMATNNQSYSDYAQQIYKSFQFPFPNGALNWDQHTSATPVLLTQLAIMNPSLGINMTKYQSDSEIWLDNIVNKNMPQTFTTPGGLFWFEGDSNSASLNPALNAAFLATIYRGMASNTSKEQQYHDFAGSQMDYALGKNPMNAVYPVGIHNNSAQNPQSALASGGTNPLQIDTVPLVEAHVLYSGVVGGPNQDDNYYDERGNWAQTEVALDSQSALIVLIAHQLATNASDPFYVGMTQSRVILPYDSGSGSGGEGLSPGAKGGIAVAVIVVIFGILAGLAFWKREQIRSFVRRRKYSKASL